MTAVRQAESFLLAAALLLPALAFAADPLPRARPESVGVSSQRLQHIGNVFKRDIAAGRLPGAVIAIARKGKLVYYETFGYMDPEAKTPMPKDAIFAPASMEKPMITTIVMQLLEEGRLVMADPVEKYLPQLGKRQVAVMGKDASGKPVMTMQPAKGSITIQDLLRHTAGITYGRRGDTPVHKMYPISSNWAAENLTGAQFLETLGKLPLFYEPGTKWDYSLSFDVLGLMIEAIEKKPLGEVMQQRLFGPLKMTDTAFVISAEKAHRYARPLSKDPDTGRDIRIRDVREKPKFDCGGGCASFTAADYLRFAQMLANGGSLDGVRIISRKSVEYMTSNQLGPEVDVSELRDFNNLAGYGMGLGVAVRLGNGVSPMMGTTGDYNWGGANGTYFWVDPKEQLVVVYMAHTPGQPRLHYRQVITTLALQALTGQ